MIAVTVVLGLGAGTASAQASDTGTATVTYGVGEVTLLTLAGNATVIISAGTAGGGLPDATDSTSVTYSITNNAAEDGMKLIGKIDTDMPTATVLSVNVTAPTGGTSLNWVVLTTSDQDLVSDIDPVDEASIPISFKLAATVAAGIIGPATKTFTMTLVTK